MCRRTALADGVRACRAIYLRIGEDLREASRPYWSVRSKVLGSMDGVLPPSVMPARWNIQTKFWYESGRLRVFRARLR
jgi:hypothetical protein